MAYKEIYLGGAQTLVDTTTDVIPVVDAALGRAEAYPIHLATELETYYGVFPHLLRVMINLHGDEGQRRLIADNLMEENGSGDPSRDHRVLYGNFLRSLKAAGIKDRTQVVGKADSGTTMAHVAAEAQLDIMTRQSYPAGVAALLALERRGPHQMGQLRAFYETLGGTAIDLEFFDLHIEDDVEHGELFRSLLSSEVRTPGDLVDAQRGIGMIVASDTLFWQSI